ncbi:MAG: transporter substrate-binding domain-containing protein, partial [Acidimicrobiales bacterium]
MRDSRAGPRRSSLVAIAVLLVAVLVVASCSSSPRDATTTTTTATTVELVTTSTTTTTLGTTNDRAFHTRRRGVLTVATDQAEAPYFIYDVATGAVYDGFEFDVARALASRLGLGGVRVVRDTLESIAAGFDCECDVYLGGVAVTATLARRVDFSVPYVDASPAVLVRVGTVPPTVATAPELRWAVVTLDEDTDGVLRNRI